MYLGSSGSMPMTQVRFMKLPLFTYWSRSPRIFAVGSIFEKEKQQYRHIDWRLWRAGSIMKIDKKQINAILGLNFGSILIPVVKNNIKIGGEKKSMPSRLLHTNFVKYFTSSHNIRIECFRCKYAFSVERTNLQENLLFCLCCSFVHPGSESVFACAVLCCFVNALHTGIFYLHCESSKYHDPFSTAIFLRCNRFFYVTFIFIIINFRFMY
jgi:hypothetical protein